MATFHHAYNGIPTVREHISAGGLPSFYDDQVPTPLDQLATDLISGTISVEIETKTPTVAGFRRKDGKIAVPSATGNGEGATDTDAIIPATALKGMLSSAYEAVTESRLRVFSGHEHRYSQRPAARNAQHIWPAFLSLKNGKQWELKVATPVRQPPKDASYWSDGNKPTPVGLPDDSEVYSDVRSLRSEARHMDTVYYSQQRQEVQKDAYRYIATRIRKDGGSVIDLTQPSASGNAAQQQRMPTAVGDTPQMKGYVVRTRPDTFKEEKSGTKKYEFIFPFSTDEDAITIPVSQELFNSLVDVIFDYSQNVFELRKKERQRKADPRRRSTNSRSSEDHSTRLVEGFTRPRLDREAEGDRSAMIVTRDDVKKYLEDLASDALSNEWPGIPVFAGIIGSEGQTHHARVVSLSPSQIGRITTEASLPPAALAEDGGVAPASTISQASPGDRLWGFVGQDTNDDSVEPRALSGRIRVSDAIFQAEGSVDTNPVVIHDTPVTLTLASPKPFSGVPYLRDETGDELEKSSDTSSKNPFPHHRTFLKGQTLIRKVYPTHYGEKEGPQKKTASEADSVMSTRVHSWIKAGSKFATQMEFINLTMQELAILLWLLAPSRLSSGRKGNKIREGHHHIGLGKPLGMGTVRVEAVSLRYHTGKMIARDYAELNGVLGHVTHGTEKAIASIIDDELPDLFSQSVVVRSFKRQAAGWKDQTPVAYPGTPQGSSTHSDVKDHPTLRWFKEREDNRTELDTLMSITQVRTDKEQEKLEELEKEFGKYRFPTLLS